MAGDVLVDMALEGHADGLGRSGHSKTREPCPCEQCNRGAHIICWK